MAWDDLFSAFLTIFVLVAIFILGYCAITKKTLTELFNELKDMIIGKKEEVLKK
jgi:hypothetical protein